MPDPSPNADNVADAGSAYDLVHGWKRCRNEDEYSDWLRMHLAAARDGGPELRAAMAAAECVRFDDYLEEELLEAEEEGDGERMAELVGERAQVMAERRDDAQARLHGEVVKQAVRTATTPEQGDP